MKEKAKFRFYIALFSLAVFILAALGIAYVYLGLRSPFLLAFGYVAAFALLLAFANDFLMDKYKLSGKKVLLLTFGVIAMATIVTQTVWTIVTPSWSFSVSTDKPTYGLGEEVNITASLKNTGFITHSFKSLVIDPVIIDIEYEYPTNPTITSYVWYNPIHQSITEFSIEPSKSLERIFIWNQTNAYYPEKKIEPGSYRIVAFIPSDDPDKGIGGNYLFVTGTRINITAL